VSESKTIEERLNEYRALKAARFGSQSNPPAVDTQPSFSSLMSLDVDEKSGIKRQPFAEEMSDAGRNGLPQPEDTPPSKRMMKKEAARPITAPPSVLATPRPRLGLLSGGLAKPPERVLVKDSSFSALPGTARKQQKPNTWR
jgi:hypothetical protein